MLLMRGGESGEWSEFGDGESKLCRSVKAVLEFKNCLFGGRGGVMMILDQQPLEWVENGFSI
jgi:hypothetical protein